MTGLTELKDWHFLAEHHERQARGSQATRQHLIAMGVHAEAPTAGLEEVMAAVSAAVLPLETKKAIYRVLFGGEINQASQAA